MIDAQVHEQLECPEDGLITEDGSEPEGTHSPEEEHGGIISNQCGRYHLTA
jgi:hypothetical protein